MSTISPPTAPSTLQAANGSGSAAGFHIRELDGLRGIAVLLVLWAHMPFVKGLAITQLFVKLGTYTKIGYLGVDLFFVLSGFLITRILIREKERGELSIGRFYWKRLIRIFPIYYITLLICVMQWGWQPGTWSQILYLSNYELAFNTRPGPLRHTWSLSVEEQFYIVWPLLMIFASNARMLCRCAIPVFALVTAVLFVVFYGEETGVELIFRSVTTRALSLSMGAVIAFYEGDRRYLLRSMRVAAPVAVVALIVVAAFRLVRLEGVSHAGEAIGKMVMFSCISYMVVSSIVLWRHSSAPIATFTSRLLTQKPLLYFGKISYGIYLYHLPIYFWLGHSHTQDRAAPWQMFLVALILPIVIAGLSYWLLESRLLKYKSRYDDVAGWFQSFLKLKQN